MENANAIEVMTADQAQAAFAVVMDSEMQQKLLDDTSHPNCWMLKFVFDSSCLRALEKRAAQLAIY